MMLGKENDRPLSLRRHSIVEILQMQNVGHSSFVMTRLLIHRVIIGYARNDRKTFSFQQKLPPSMPQRENSRSQHATFFIVNCIEMDISCDLLSACQLHSIAVMINSKAVYSAFSVLLKMWVYQNGTLFPTQRKMFYEGQQGSGHKQCTMQEIRHHFGC